MPKLGVNIDHVATLREARHGINPDPVLAAIISENSGADSIVVHLREDRRHIKERDLFLLRKTVKTRLNLEMSLSQEIVEIACKAKPDQATLVPEKRQELTTEGGLDVIANYRKIKKARALLNKNNIQLSLFIDPDKSQIAAAADLGIDMIELHTGSYADAKTSVRRNKLLKQIRQCTDYASREMITVNAGHGLDYNNVSPIARINNIEELNIGYSIICRAVFVGLGRAIQEMKNLL